MQKRCHATRSQYSTIRQKKNLMPKPGQAFTRNTPAPGAHPRHGRWRCISGRSEISGPKCSVEKMFTNIFLCLLAFDSASGHIPLSRHARREVPLRVGSPAGSGRRIAPMPPPWRQDRTPIFQTRCQPCPFTARAEPVFRQDPDQRRPTRTRISRRNESHCISRCVRRTMLCGMDRRTR